MKLMNMTALVSLGVAAFAKDVQFDYNRSTNKNYPSGVGKRQPLLRNRVKRICHSIQRLS